MTDVTERKFRGRPRKNDQTAEEQLEARREQQRLYSSHRQVMTLDKAIIAELHGVGDRLETEMGFRPSLSQTLRYLIKRAKL